MTVIADGPVSSPRPKPLTPDRYERALAYLSVLMLVAVLAAIVRGAPEWSRVPPFVWLHLATISVALALTPILLLRVRGTRQHRRLGWIWAAAMAGTAASTFFIRSHDGRFSVIHILSVGTLITIPALVVAARRHRVASHRTSVRATVTGALLIAGFFTFPFGRMLGRWLFG
ncbi:DUF2306 domain-containing protein [Parvularcula dongshanensis]|uniref:Putative membrane protein n=1 Tax=Parvularcula dongshanensis TaxID=1173995 RepID=A0A840I627_9PROT|nr:hypothetical protein [Parvularcula dongshanensis]MBB4660329.1 putative membrane protein [Parvularcula dongshanensis]